MADQVAAKLAVEPTEPREHEDYEAFEEIPEEEIFEPLADHEYECSRIAAECSDTGGVVSEENAFQVIRLESEHCKDIFRAKATVQIIKRFVVVVGDVVDS
jgi:hypothetical protein